MTTSSLNDVKLFETDNEISTIFTTSRDRMLGLVTTCRASRDCTWPRHVGTRARGVRLPVAGGQF